MCFIKKNIYEAQIIRSVLWMWFERYFINKVFDIEITPIIGFSRRLGYFIWTSRATSKCGQTQKIKIFRSAFSY